MPPLLACLSLARSPLLCKAWSFFQLVFSIPANPLHLGGTFKNCCLVVEHIERCVHLLLTVPDLDEALAPEIAAQAI